MVKTNLLINNGIPVQQRRKNHKKNTGKLKKKWGKSDSFCKRSVKWCVIPYDQLVGKKSQKKLMTKKINQLLSKTLAITCPPLEIFPVFLFLRTGLVALSRKISMIGFDRPVCLKNARCCFSIIRMGLMTGAIGRLWVL